MKKYTIKFFNTSKLEPPFFNTPFGLAVFRGVFEKFCCNRVFKAYFGIFLENILGYLRVEEFLKYILRYFLKF